MGAWSADPRDGDSCDVATGGGAVRGPAPLRASAASRSAKLGAGSARVGVSRSPPKAAALYISVGVSRSCRTFGATFPVGIPSLVTGSSASISRCGGTAVSVVPSPSSGVGGSGVTGAGATIIVGTGTIAASDGATG